MELIGSYYAQGYKVEAYFPVHSDPDTWTIWVLKDGRMLGEFKTCMPVTSAYGMDDVTLKRLEKVATDAVRSVMRDEVQGELRTMREYAEREAQLVARMHQRIWQSRIQEASNDDRMSTTQ